MMRLEIPKLENESPNDVDKLEGLVLEERERPQRMPGYSLLRLEV